MSLRYAAPCLALMVILGCAEQPDTPEGRFEALGQRTYQNTCIQCHQADGQGIRGVYPPITQNEWVEGDEGRLIRLILHGMEGPIVIDGVTYDQRMQPLGRLTDDQIAAVLTYVRNNFGNDASAVDPDDVSKVRAHSDRDRPWRADELWEATGIPNEDSLMSWRTVP